MNRAYLAQYVAVFLWAYNIKTVTDDFLRAMGGRLPTDGHTSAVGGDDRIVRAKYASSDSRVW